MLPFVIEKDICQMTTLLFKTFPTFFKCFAQFLQSLSYMSWIKLFKDEFPATPQNYSNLSFQKCIDLFGTWKDTPPYQTIFLTTILSKLFYKKSTTPYSHSQTMSDFFLEKNVIFFDEVEDSFSKYFLVIINGNISGSNKEIVAFEVVKMCYQQIISLVQF